MRSLLLSLLLLSCSSEEEKSIESPPDIPSLPVDSAEPEPDEQPPGIGSESLGEGDIHPEEEEPHRNRKRMSVSQIMTSISQVSGGIEWTVQGTNKWEQYADTLGVPDYLQRIREDTDPGIMFQKFLNDAAVHTCREWVTLEEESEQRLFFSEIEPDEDDLQKIRLNIVALRQRIHGAPLNSEHPMIDSLQQLYELVLQRGGASTDAWTTICVGLFTHPDFFSY